MKNIFLAILPFVLLLFAPSLLQATHNRAGEIRVEQIGDCRDLTIKATIITYTKETATDADRDSLELCWGDGTCTVLQRSNGANNQGEIVGNNIKMNIYMGTHTYPGRSTYVLSMTDPNRVAQIRNIAFPNSVNIPFHLTTTYTFLNPQFEGCNSTPALLQPPIDVACVGQPFIHNPNAFDPDGDSISYELTVPLQGVGVSVPNYFFLDQVPVSPNNNLTLNPVTGDIVWDAPQQPGEYNLAIHIIEWRNGIPIDTTLRDMQITVEDCNNLPPEVEVPFEEICVIAGDTLDFEVIATAPIEESTQEVRLQAFGGPLELDISPAFFEQNNEAFNEQPSVKRFTWVTTCEHISNQPYSIVFKATDNLVSPGADAGLANLKTVRIKVVGPPPEDLQATSESGDIVLTWEKPYACEDTENDYFRGFSIWRKLGSNPFEVDTCETGLAGKGYERIAFNQLGMTDDGTRYQYADRGLDRGKTYCYRILADFARTSPLGNFFYNPVSSLPSEEVCLQLSRDIPLITNVDVLTTDTDDGSIFIAWSKPSAEDLDTLQNPGPYRYQLLRSNGNANNFVPVAGADFVSPDFAAANDTTFTEFGLNTTTTQYFYKVAFYVNNEAEPLGETEVASSVFLTVAPTDRANQLSWSEQVPWINQSYIIFEKVGAELITLDTVAQSSYTHTGLDNGTAYCYVVESIGTYGITDVVDPIFNTSQEACGIPSDNVPPCPPTLAVENICDENPTNVIDELTNTLDWTNPNEVCEETNDVASYNIYYAPTTEADFTRIGTTDGAMQTQYFDMPGGSIAGCYYVTAIDTAFNESAPSNTICVDNCPNYELPNTFTPNGDGSNDLFIPFPYRFIERIDLQIFNRWGALVFETSDPNINWDGVSLNGEALAEGVYFYTCQVFEQRVTGVQPQEELLKGYIHLIKSNQ